MGGETVFKFFDIMYRVVDMGQGRWLVLWSPNMVWISRISIVDEVGKDNKMWEVPFV